MKLPRILYTKPSITDLEVRYASDAAQYGWGEHCYDYINRFEKSFETYLGVKHAIATSSCTGALHMGLSALDIGPGDEVILADTNWIASAAPVVYLGATPIFVDILPETWCIDPSLVEKAITPKTKAIIAVHLYGNLCEMKELMAIGEKNKIPIVEDAAEAIGSVYHGKRAGSIGRFGVFSFHGTKTVSTGEGGMFVTDDDTLYETVLTLSNHGRSRGQTRQFYPDMVGFKYKMSNVQAAIGCAQMERIEDLVNRKREIFDYYARNLLHLPGIFMNPEKRGTINGYWMPNAVFASERRLTKEKILKAFVANDIDARVFFCPLSGMSMFRSVPSNRFAWEIPERAINLPSYYDLTEAELNRVVEVVKNLLR